MKTGLLGVLAILATLLAAPAAAQGDSHVYLGGSIGYSQYKDTCRRVFVPCDDHDTAWRAFGGYQFNRYISAEVGYAQLGSVTGQGDLFGTGAASYRLESKAWDLSALAHIRVTERVQANLRAGIYRARTTEDQEGAFGTLHGGSTNGGLTYGAGAGVNLGRFGVRAEWQRYENVGGTDILVGEDDIDVFSVGVLFRF